MSSAAAVALPLRSSDMLSREQLLHLFRRFSELTSLPEMKKRIADAVKDKQEAVGVTTAIQEEIFLEMGIDPGFGISSLGKVNDIYGSDQDLMIQFYRFVAREEMACDEAELGPEEFIRKIHAQTLLYEQQLDMLKNMRKHSLDEQSSILEVLHQNLENSGFDSCMSVLTSTQIEEILQSRAAK